MDNPKPQFVCQNILVNQANIIGKEHNHLRFNFKFNDNNKQYTAIGWHIG